MKEKTIGLLELQTEKTKLEGDRAVLAEKIQALTAETAKSQQQLTMIAGAIQALNQLIERAETEKVEIDTDSEK